MTKPNFLIIGAAKAGTTAIHNYLKQHPQVYMCPVKEPMFFAFEGEKLNFKGSRSQNINNSITNYEDYKALFSDAATQKAIGESSPIYLYSEKAPERISHYLPDAKLIVILRNPIERAYSHYLMLVRNGVEKPNQFIQAIQNEGERDKNRLLPAIPYISGGFYYSQLSRYFDRFGVDQIKIYLYEDLVADSTALLKDIFKFIDVSPDFEPDVSTKHNVSGVPKNRLLKSLVDENNLIKSVAKSLFPDSFRKEMSSKINKFNLDKPSIPPEARSLLKSTYQQEVLNLQNLIHRDLSFWLHKN